MQILVYVVLLHKTITYNNFSNFFQFYNKTLYLNYNTLIETTVVQNPIV